MEEGPSRFTVRPRVLVVDDEEIVRLVLARALRLSGFDVFEARDGLEALARMPVAAPDLVLTDLNMPRCNGEMLCAELKRRQTTAGVPVVMMTGGPQDEAHMREVGFAAVIYKPLPERLADFLLSILQNASPASRAGGWTAAPTDPIRQPPAA
jgi:CheY-like chemotaxis protein